MEAAAASTTLTLADTLLDDLDDLSDGGGGGEDEENDKEEDQQQQQEQPPSQSKNDNDNNNEPEEDGKQAASSFELLHKNSALQAHLQRIQAWNNNNQSQQDNDDDKDYQAMVTSNTWHRRLADHIQELHTQLRNVYQVKFPELSDVVPDALDYAACVLAIQNEFDLTKVDALETHLPSHVRLTLTVASSVTQGRALTNGELESALQLARAIQDTHTCQLTLQDFVSNRIAHLAPSLTALLGASTASRLLATAGGLMELAQIPACNLQVLGQATRSKDARGVVATMGQGQSASAPAPQAHQGILIHSDLFQEKVLSAQHRQKLLKQVAAKAALCARHDAVNVQQGRPRSAAAGEQYRSQISTKLQQWQAPDTAPTQKALPKPDLTVKKRRGGKRMRHWKERFEETNLMKKANTRAFSSQAGEYGDDAMGKTLGLLDTEEGGNEGVRKNTTEAKKMRMSNTKAARKQRAHASKISGQYQPQDTTTETAAATTSSGMASTVAFTPLQAMELVNPEAQAERVRRANQKWFADTAGFQSALPKK